jgi:exopolysaccharide biosynthesis polyprenyl glycosylphosphotransferase
VPPRERSVTDAIAQLTCPSADGSGDGATQLLAATSGTRVAVSKHWRGRYQRVVFAIDLFAAIAAVLVGFVERFGDRTAMATPSHLAFAISLPVAWVFCAALNRAYEVRLLGAGTIEFERVGRAFLQLTAVTTFVAYATKAQLSRGFILVALPLTLVLSVTGRYIARKRVHRNRRVGKVIVPVLAVGSPAEINALSETLERNGHTGLRIAAACVPKLGADAAEVATTLGEHGIALLGDVDTIREAVHTTGAQSVAVVSRDISGEKLRWISWQLEGSDTDLVVLPGLTEVAGRRLDVQQVGGLPLLYVAQPEFKGVHRVLKAAFDRCVAALAVAMLIPVMVGVAIAVRLTSRGPALFFQTRVGKDGKTFRMVKFRSMRRDAEKLVVQLETANEVEGGTLFKIRQDPRVTRVGKFLRRFSLDELPQLFNVLAGSMSLVGPRPPLPSEVAQYETDVHRRLLVKPGLTGLWQVSGRSDLSWEESVRLDLRYVENWSLSLDVVLLLRTLAAVFRARGAY